MPYSDILTRCPIFRGLPSHRIRELLASVTSRVRRYSKGEMIAQAGEECRYLMIVVEGSVKGEMTDASGRVIKIEDVETPRPIGFSFIFGQQNFLPVNVTANEETAVMFIPKPDLISMLQSDKQVLQNVLDVISSRGQFLSQKIRTLSLKSLRDRIAQMLLELSREQGNTVTLPSSQSELADYFGVARPSLARTLGEMADEGLIVVNRRIITIPDIRKLAAVLSDRS
ncbi:MAG TPA: Crp/Fnr family transcriptional regulator [Bacteroidales bacterium]|nr:Crp/Fnr family transcriptional regulator [Bacteroidales bacterium]HRZ47895.1 Crp/Fnr family transcriptional regulator [Bacteroidales bacterium]